MTPIRTRRAVLLAGLAAPLARGLSAQPLLVRLDGDLLHITAPQFHFLSGKPLERLKDGASVGFISQLSLSFEPNGLVQKRAIERFVFSYDLWEERFSVVRRGHPARSAARLAGSAAEAWCLENLSLDISGIAPDRPFWIRMEIRAEDPREQAVVGEPGINLTRLVEIFSRAPKTQQAPSVIESGPLRIEEVRRRGARSG